MAELIVERISYELSLDPIEVRLTNLDSEHKDLREMINTLKNSSEFTKRKLEVNKFNAQNKWNKRGLRFSISKFTPEAVQIFDVNLSVYHGDGTISIVHSGIEMGQGINTKAVQICAYLLKIPINKIQIKGNNTIISPNGAPSIGSVTSQNVGIGVYKCCQQLLSKLDPIKRQMNNPTWEELIEKAFESNVDLQCHGFFSTASDGKEYNIYGVALAEIEIDVLTGQSEILRVDILQDVGQSVSPEIDLGQVEGAFVMGLGYWTTEKLIYDKSGDLLTDRTWNYYVPQARDIPQDFRVSFRKNSYGEERYFGAKATGEPPICLSVVVPIAIREALVAARLEAGLPSTSWFDIDGPYTVEKICLAAETKLEDFKLY